MKQWEAWAMRRRSPGTWTAEEVGSTGGENPMPVYEVLAGNQWRVAEHVSEADARLIAAAPDLLDALRAARGCVENAAVLRVVDAALAKADQKAPAPSGTVD